MDRSGIPRRPRERHDGGWTRRRSRHLFQSQWYNLRQDELRLPDGREITYTQVEHPGYVMVLPVLDDGRAVVERVFRHTLQETLLECPAGGRDPGEDPQAAAARELEEETGWRAERWIPLGRYAGSSGISDELFDLFLALELDESGQIQREPGEQMEVELVELGRLRRWIDEGALRDAPSVMAVLLASDWLREHEPGLWTRASRSLRPVHPRT